MPYALFLVTFEQHPLEFIDGRFVDFFGFVGIMFVLRPVVEDVKIDGRKGS